jgi:hypothetical protein
VLLGKLMVTACTSFREFLEPVKEEMKEITTGVLALFAGLIESETVLAPEIESAFRDFAKAAADLLSQNRDVDSVLGRVLGRINFASEASAVHCKFEHYLHFHEPNAVKFECWGHTPRSHSPKPGTCELKNYR